MKYASTGAGFLKSRQLKENLFSESQAPLKAIGPIPLDTAVRYRPSRPTGNWQPI